MSSAVNLLLESPVPAKRKAARKRKRGKKHAAVEAVTVDVTLLSDRRPPIDVMQSVQMLRGLRDMIQSRYRYCTDDRNDEICLKDIVSAPIPRRLVREEQNFVGIVRHIGGITKSDLRVKFLGLELCEPIGDGDGSAFDARTGRQVQHFRTKPNHAVFVSVEDGIRKLPTDVILTLLNDTISKLRIKLKDVYEENLQLKSEKKRLQSSLRSVRTLSSHSQELVSEMTFEMEQLQESVSQLRADLEKEKAVNAVLRQVKDQIFTVGSAAASAAKSAAEAAATVSCQKTRPMAAVRSLETEERQKMEAMQSGGVDIVVEEVRCTELDSIVATPPRTPQPCLEDVITSASETSSQIRTSADASKMKKKKKRKSLEQSAATKSMKKKKKKKKKRMSSKKKSKRGKKAAATNCELNPTLQRDFSTQTIPTPEPSSRLTSKKEATIGDLTGAKLESSPQSSAQPITIVMSEAVMKALQSGFLEKLRPQPTATAAVRRTAAEETVGSEVTWDSMRAVGGSGERVLSSSRRMKARPRMAGYVSVPSRSPMAAYMEMSSVPHSQRGSFAARVIGGSPQMLGTQQMVGVPLSSGRLMTQPPVGATSSVPIMATMGRSVSTPVRVRSIHGLSPGGRIHGSTDGDFHKVLSATGSIPRRPMQKRLSQVSHMSQVTYSSSVDSNGRAQPSALTASTRADLMKTPTTPDILLGIGGGGMLHRAVVDKNARYGVKTESKKKKKKKSKKKKKKKKKKHSSKVPIVEDVADDTPKLPDESAMDGFVSVGYEEMDEEREEARRRRETMEENEEDEEEKQGVSPKRSRLRPKVKPHLAKDSLMSVSASLVSESTIYGDEAIEDLSPAPNWERPSVIRTESTASMTTFTGVDKHGPRPSQDLVSAVKKQKWDELQKEIAMRDDQLVVFGDGDSVEMASALTAHAGDGDDDDDECKLQLEVDFVKLPEHVVIAITPPQSQNNTPYMAAAGASPMLDIIGDSSEYESTTEQESTATDHGVEQSWELQKGKEDEEDEDVSDISGYSSPPGIGEDVDVVDIKGVDNEDDVVDVDIEEEEEKEKEVFKRPKLVVSHSDGARAIGETPISAQDYGVEQPTDIREQTPVVVNMYPLEENEDDDMDSESDYEDEKDDALGALGVAGDTLPGTDQLELNLRASEKISDMPTLTPIGRSSYKCAPPPHVRDKTDPSIGSAKVKHQRRSGTSVRSFESPSPEHMDALDAPSPMLVLEECHSVNTTLSELSPVTSGLLQPALISHEPSDYALMEKTGADAKSSSHSHSTAAAAVEYNVSDSDAEKEECVEELPFEMISAPVIDRSVASGSGGSESLSTGVYDIDMLEAEDETIGSSPEQRRRRMQLKRKSSHNRSQSLSGCELSTVGAISGAFHVAHISTAADSVGMSRERGRSRSLVMQREDLSPLITTLQTMDDDVTRRHSRILSQGVDEKGYGFIEITTPKKVDDQFEGGYTDTMTTPQPEIIEDEEEEEKSPTAPVPLDALLGYAVGSSGGVVKVKHADSDYGKEEEEEGDEEISDVELTTPRLPLGNLQPTKKLSLMSLPISARDILIRSGDEAQDEAEDGEFVVTISSSGIVEAKMSAADMAADGKAELAEESGEKAEERKRSSSLKKKKKKRKKRKKKKSKSKRSMEGSALLAATQPLTAESLEAAERGDGYSHAVATAVGAEMGDGSSVPVSIPQHFAGGRSLGAYTMQRPVADYRHAHGRKHADGKKPPPFQSMDLTRTAPYATSAAISTRSSLFGSGTYTLGAFDVAYDTGYEAAYDSGTGTFMSPSPGPVRHVSARTLPAMADAMVMPSPPPPMSKPQ